MTNVTRTKEYVQSRLNLPGSARREDVVDDGECETGGEGRPGWRRQFYGQRRLSSGVHLNQTAGWALTGTDVARDHLDEKVAPILILIVAVVVVGFVFFDSEDATVPIAEGYGMSPTLPEPRTPHHKTGA
jgi:hypothetical protein